MSVKGFLGTSNQLWAYRVILNTLLQIAGRRFKQGQKALLLWGNSATPLQDRTVRHTLPRRLLQSTDGNTSAQMVEETMRRSGLLHLALAKDSLGCGGWGQPWLQWPWDVGLSGFPHLTELSFMLVVSSLSRPPSTVSWSTLWFKYCAAQLSAPQRLSQTRHWSLSPLSLPFPTVVGLSWELLAQKVKMRGWDKNNLLETAMR